MIRVLQVSFILSVLLISVLGFASMAESKEQFEQRIEKNLKEARAELLELKAALKSETAEKKEKINKEISAVEGKIDTAEKELKKLKTASRSAWKKFRSGVEKAWGNVQTGYRDAKQELRERDSAASR